MVIDPTNGKERQVKDIKKMQQIVMDAISNKPITKHFVQATVVGKKNEWLTFWPVKEFQAKNPDVELSW